MIRQAKKYKQFFRNLGDGVDELIRSKKSTLGSGSLKPGSQGIHHLMSGKADPKMIDFICKCLVFEAEDRMTP